MLADDDAAAQPQVGGWWGLFNLQQDAEQEFDQWKQIVETDGGIACPRCGEPFSEAPPGPSGKGAGITRYCRYDGYQVPRDVIPLRHGVKMGRDG